MDWLALRVTLKLAVCTTLILAVIGLPLAYWLATSRRLLTRFVDALVGLPLILPPTVIGFYLMWSAAPDGWLGRISLATTGRTLPFTFLGILMASVVYNLPFAVRPLTVAFASVDLRLVEAASCLGSSRWRTFRTITLPLARPGILAGLILTFAHTIGEFGVVLMVGGNIPGVTRTLSVVIYDDVQALEYHRANQTAAVLLAGAFVMLCLVHYFQRREPR